MSKARSRHSTRVPATWREPWVRRDRLTAGPP